MIEPNFFMLKPFAVTETELVIAPPDAENDVYAGGTTYATDELVWYGGNIWRSLQDSNTGNTPVEGAWWTDLGEVDQGATAYNAGTTYALNDLAVYQGYVWKSATGGNTGNTPSTTSVQWTQQQATNRYKAFDSFLQDAATVSGGLTYQLTFTNYPTHIAILRASGSSVQVTMTDATDGVVFDETYSLVDDSLITDWWAYFFEPIVEIDTVLVEGLPPYAGADIDIVISGESASVSQIVTGAAVPIGAVRVGTAVGIESYSVKERDDFNRFDIVARPYSDTADFDVAIDTLKVGYIKRRLAEAEATQALYFMEGGAPYGAIAYGFFRDFQILHSTPVISDCVLEIEGLG